MSKFYLNLFVAEAKLNKLIDEVKKKIIFQQTKLIGGFSQGCMISLANRNKKKR